MRSASENRLKFCFFARSSAARVTWFKYVQKFSKEKMTCSVAGLVYEVGWKLAHKRGGSSLACACGLRLIDNVLCVSRPVIRIASSSLRIFSDRLHMAGTYSIVE